MSANIENLNDKISTRLRYIENRTRELERLFPDHVFEQDSGGGLSGVGDGNRDARIEDETFEDEAFEDEAFEDEPSQDGDPGHAGESRRRARSSRPDPRTETLIRHGRGARRTRLIRPRNIALAVCAGCGLLVVAMLTVFSAGRSWPGSVAVVRTEILKACQNPDVASEPDQVNFACGKTTQQVLWVFALLTSKDDPRFVSAKTGRSGLEPITPALGGQLAWSLNLHQPYDPANPTDSLEVAARAINNIVGGATVTGSSGKTVVEPGLESHPGNCARYTGSPAVVARAGYPSLCALPVTTAEGQAALVADIYQQWVVGASQVAAQDAAVLFENANNPGNAQVQAILNEPPDSGL